MKNNILGAVVIGLIVASGAFYAGMQYGKGKNVDTMQARFSGMNGGQFVQGGASGRVSARGAGGGATSGSILSMDDKSVTIKLRDGGSKIVFFSTSTQVQTSKEGSVADLGVGVEIVAMGTTNSDGSVTAQSIQVRPNAPILR